jgi:hypothetical protein
MAEKIQDGVRLLYYLFFEIFFTTFISVAGEASIFV